MTEARLRLVVDHQGVTIATDRFHLRTAESRTFPLESTPQDVLLEVAESGEIEAIVSELETMTRRTYGQFDPVSRALELVGERWAMLIIRDLLVCPKRFVDLRRGLPAMPANVLSSRLRELEHAGVIQAVPAGEAVAYELTEFGSELEEVVLGLGRWGARALGESRPGEIITTDSMVMALRTMFQEDIARDVRLSFEIRLDDIVLHARVEGGVLYAGGGPLPGADLSIAPGMAFQDLVTGRIVPADAVASGTIRITGDVALLERFAEIFRMPAPVAEL